MSNEGLVLPIDLRDDEAIPAFGGGPGGPRLPTGTFTMDIVGAEKITNKKGGAMAKVTFKVADEGEYFGVEVPKWYSLNTVPSKEGGVPAIGRFKRLMQAAGCSLHHIDFGELIGARVIVEIIHTEGQGKVDAQGNVQPGGIFCDVTNEKAVAGAEEVPPPPPPAAKKPAPAAAAAPAATKPAPAARRA